MLSSRVNFEFAINLPTETVVGNHATHCTLNEQLRVACAAGAEGFRLVATYIAGETHIFFLRFFLPADLHLGSVDHHDEIAVINVWCIRGLGFAAKQVGNFHGDVAEMLVAGVHEEPAPCGVVGFCRKCPFSWHDRIGHSIGFLFRVNLIFLKNPLFTLCSL